MNTILTKFQRFSTCEGYRMMGSGHGTETVYWTQARVRLFYLERNGLFTRESKLRIRHASTFARCLSGPVTPIPDKLTPSWRSGNVTPPGHTKEGRDECKGEFAALPCRAMRNHCERAEATLSARMGARVSARQGLTRR